MLREHHDIERLPLNTELGAVATGSKLNSSLIAVSVVVECLHPVATAPGSVLSGNV